MTEPTGHKVYPDGVSALRDVMNDGMTLMSRRIRRCAAFPEHLIARVHDSACAI